MIARSWRGTTAARDADAYLKYLHQTGLADYRKIEGNCGVLALRRIVNDKAEFLLISLWDSEDAIRKFAGADIERAVFYPEDDRFLIDREERVSHYEVAFDSALLPQS
jgi:heme-degrading monooxygenase HmoA